MKIYNPLQKSYFEFSYRTSISFTIYNAVFLVELSTMCAIKYKSIKKLSR